VFGAAPVLGGAVAAASWRAFPWVATTYFAEGLPFSLVHQVSSQVLVALGSSPSAVGLTALYGLAWNFKFLVGPLVDGLGTLRRWIVALEVALAVGAVGLSFAAGARDAGAVARIFVAIAVMAAVHDVATDGFYLAALPPREQAALSGLRVAAYRAAMLFANGALVILAGLTSFRLSFIVAAAVLAGLAFAHRRFLPHVEPDEAAAARKPAFADAVRSFLAKESFAATLLFLLLFRAGDAMLFAMNAPFLSSLGLDTSARGVLQGIVGTAFSITGAVLGGVLISRRGLRSTLLPIAALQSSALVLYFALAATRPPFAVVCVLSTLEQLAAGIGTAGLTVFILERSRGDHKAAHFAFATALMTVATTIAGSVSGYVVEAVGFASFFAIAFAASVPGVVFARFVPKDAST
jgi:PAT family beta-lactamase induction signal transducer AmpG